MRQITQCFVLLWLLFVSLNVTAQLPLGAVVVPGNGSPDSFDPSKIDMTKLPVLDLSNESIRSNPIEVSEAKRAQTYVIGNGPPLIDSNGVEYVPSPRIVCGIAVPLFTSKFRKYVIYDLAIMGTVTEATAHLNSNGSDVYSLYQIIPSATFVGTPPTGASFEIERAGGLIKYPSGKWAIDGVSGYGLLQVGHKYVMFIQTMPWNRVGPQLITAYEITPGDIVYPNDVDSTHSNEKYAGVPLATFVSDLKTATAKEGSTPTNPSESQ